MLVIQQIIVVTVAVGAAGHAHFGEIDREPAVRVVKDNMSGGHAGTRPVLGPVEDHVLGLLAAQQRIGLLPQHPAQRVGNIRLPRAVRPDDGGNTARKLEGGLRCERFISLQFEGFKTKRHVCYSLKSIEID